MKVLTIILYFVLLLTFIVSVDSENFCNAFRGHQNRISYVFRQGVRYNPASNKRDDYYIAKHHVIIDGRNWILVFDRNKDEVIFDQNGSKAAPVFTDKYFEAATLWTGGAQGNAKTMLFVKDSAHKVYITNIPGNKFDKAQDLNKFEEPKEYSLLGVPLGNFEFVFRANSPDFNNPGLDFVFKSGTKYKHKRFGFTQLGSIFEVTDKTKDMINYVDFNHDKEVIMINYQSKSNGHLGYLILLQQGQAIYWCWRAFNQTQCNEKLLANCTSPATKRPEPPPSTQPPKRTELPSVKPTELPSKEQTTLPTTEQPKELTPSIETNKSGETNETETHRPISSAAPELSSLSVRPKESNPDDPKNNTAPILVIVAIISVLILVLVIAVVVLVIISKNQSTKKSVERSDTTSNAISDIKSLKTESEMESKVVPTGGKIDTELPQEVTTDRR